MVDDVEPRFRYELNRDLDSQGADLIECFRWVKGTAVESALPQESSGNS
jgi:hypothetical protein